MKRHNGRTSADCRSHDAGAIGSPGEVAAPQLTAWIEKPTATPSNRIAGVSLNALKSVAEAASEPNIFFLIRSAKGFRENVFQFEQTEDVFLGA